MIDVLNVLDGTFTSNPPTGAAITVTRASTNVLDLLAARDIAGGFMGQEMHVNVTTAFVGGTSLQIAAQFSADNSTFVDEMLSPVYLTANLTAGRALFRYRMPINQLNNTTGLPYRYFRLNYTVVGTYSAGAVIAYIAAGGDRQNFVAYSSNYSIDA